MIYRIILIPAAPNFEGSFKKYSNDFSLAASSFNAQSGSMRNKKRLTILTVEDNVLTVELSSDIELPVPAKSLRIFTQYLLKNSEIQHQVYHGSLFRSVPAAQQLPGDSIAQAQGEEEAVMGTLTRVLMGTLPHRKEIFSTIQVLLSCCRELDRSRQQEYLLNLEELIRKEAALMAKEH